MYPEQATQIKWLRLRKICETLLDNRYVVHIHGSTSLNLEIRAAVNVYGTAVDIAVNLAYAKTPEVVINLLSHELAHIVLNTADDEHSIFNETWDRLRDAITEQYEESG